ncbi:MAG TPA: rhomboid family intramembrane serine protease [Solirubrobacteraceae bacterium]|jgi:membrane associated rhomboid family serine protease
MTSGADLFVVCKQCGSEVSPYITECPYCGNRLRRRAPKLPRGGERRGGRTKDAIPSLGRLRRGEIPGIRAESHPYVMAALVLASAVAWVAWKGAYVNLGDLLIIGPLHGDWWRLFTSQFAYVSGLYEFAVVLAIAIFGWLLERRHGPLVVAALFFGAGAAGALAALSLYPAAIVSGANGPALALIAAWAMPDLLAAARKEDYEGDLLGAAAMAAIVLAMPLARTEASWVAGIAGLLIGSLAGFGLARGQLLSR